LPLFSDRYSGFTTFGSRLHVIKVNAESGFDQLGAVDHGPLYTDAQTGCVVCYDGGWCDYYCSYNPEVRRGHFVSGDDATYVYSFSHAGVLVNDVANLAENLAVVKLPAPQWSSYPWYGEGEGSDGLSDGDGADGFGTDGSDGVGDGIVEPGFPRPDAMPSEQDAGTPSNGADAGVDVSG
jgi:hypothetical protein